jgi:hypothetical protein
MSVARAVFVVVFVGVVAACLPALPCTAQQPIAVRYPLIITFSRPNTSFNIYLYLFYIKKISENFSSQLSFMGLKVHSTLAPTLCHSEIIILIYMSVWVQQEWYVDYDAQLRATIDSASGLRSIQINVHHRSARTRHPPFCFYFVYLYINLYINLFVWCTENAVQHQRGSAALHRLPAEGRHAAYGTRHSIDC